MKNEEVMMTCKKQTLEEFLKSIGQEYEEYLHMIKKELNEKHQTQDETIDEYNMLKDQKKSELKKRIKEFESLKNFTLDSDKEIENQQEIIDNDEGDFVNDFQQQIIDSIGIRERVTQDVIKENNDCDQPAPKKKKKKFRLFLFVIILIITTNGFQFWYHHQQTVLKVNQQSIKSEDAIDTSGTPDTSDELLEQEILKIEDEFESILGYTDVEVQEFTSSLNSGDRFVYLSELNDLYHEKEKELTTKLLELESEAQSHGIEIVYQNDQNMIEKINFLTEMIEQENENQSIETNQEGQNVDSNELFEQDNSENKIVDEVLSTEELNDNTTDDESLESGNIKCSTSYEQAYEQSLDIFLNDEKINEKDIVKFEIDSNNCAVWYNSAGEIVTDI